MKKWGIHHSWWRNRRGRHHPHHASGSFICRESSSVYSRGMATMATIRDVWYTSDFARHCLVPRSFLRRPVGTSFGRAMTRCRYLLGVTESSPRPWR